MNGDLKVEAHDIDGDGKPDVVTVHLKLGRFAIVICGLVIASVSGYTFL